MQYQPSLPPYQERLAQLQQQYNQQPQVNILMGKIVDSIDAVKATDIPMDGNCHYFPKADGTEIYMKRWLVNGKTEVVTYRPSTESDNKEEAAAIPSTLEEQFKGLREDVVSSFSSIDDRISKLETLMSQKNNNNRNAAKKEE